MSEFLSLKTRVIYSSLCEEMSATVERDATRLGLHEGGCALHPPSLDASAINVCVSQSRRPIILLFAMTVGQAVTLWFKKICKNNTVAFFIFI